jgi:hypothetical protein
MTANDDALQPPFVDDGAKLFGVFLRGIFSVGPAAIAVATLVRRINRKALVEMVSGQLPHSPVSTRGMQQDQVGIAAGSMEIVDSHVGAQIEIVR